MIAATADASAPRVSGFVESTFSPLVYEAVRQCLAEESGAGDRTVAQDGARTAIVLASTMGDSGTLDLGSRLLVAGETNNALLFMQSTANAILGRLSVDFAITGPLMAVSAAGDLAADLLAAADVLLAAGDVDRVILVGVELAGTERTTAAHRELGTVPPTADLAVAIVLDRNDPLPVPSTLGQSTQYGSLRGLVDLAARIRGAKS
jgi:3-oxoacyl-(acyl-carrier-protein) synthase